jgi:hypothetical protein
VRDVYDRPGPPRHPRAEAASHLHRICVIALTSTRHINSAMIFQLQLSKNLRLWKPRNARTLHGLKAPNHSREESPQDVADALDVVHQARPVNGARLPRCSDTIRTI